MNFGDYDDCADAPLIDAVTFLYLNMMGTKQDRINRFLDGADPRG